MLLQLHIRNYAIIKEIQLDFEKGLQVLTGETGAGKSILMGALGLVLGDRADSSAITAGEDKCIVEARYDVKAIPSLPELFEQYDLDFDHNITLRREINANGKSRAFVNDTPVNLNVLKRVSSEIVDLHRQFDILELGQKRFQLELVDALAQTRKLLAGYRHIYLDWERTSREWQQLKQTYTQEQAALDYIQFQYNELEEADLKENELEDAASGLEMFGQAEAIKQALQQSVHILQNDESALVDQLRQIINSLTPFEKLHKLEDVITRLQQSYIELKDISGELEDIENAVEMNAEQMEYLQSRVDLGMRLMKKHQVNSTAELLAIKNEFSAKLEQFNLFEGDLQRLEKDADLLFEKLTGSGKMLSTERAKITAPIENEVNGLLALVGMPNARIRLSLNKTENPGANGFDDITLLFDSNNTGQFEPVEKIASGGELSRLMLILKSLVAGSIEMPTLIFDEIDSGIGGEAALQVGKLLQQLASRHQLIVITHQPQIAAKAANHFQVYKQRVNNKTVTQVKLLAKEERIQIIAEMLAGFNITDAAKRTAMEMLAH